MELEVTPATLSSVLMKNQPDASSSRTIIGLALLALALTDLGATVSLGHGLTAAVAGWLIRDAHFGPELTLGLLTAVLDGSAFIMGLGMVRGTRWHALFKSSFQEAFKTAPLLTWEGSQTKVLLTWALALVIGLSAGAQLFIGGGLALAWGPAAAALASAGAVAVIGLIIVGVVGTTRLERHSVMIAGAATILVILVATVTTPSLRSAVTSAPPAAVGRIVGWIALAYGVGLTVVLLLGVESTDEILVLLMNWNPDADLSLGSYFQRNREESMLTRRSVLKISANGRQLLLVTKEMGEEQVRVVQTTALDKGHSIVLNDMGFAILDFRKMAQEMTPTRARAAGPNGYVTYSDPDNLVSFDVRIMVQTSTAALPKDFTMAEDTFTFLRDHIFASTVLGPLLDAVIAATVTDLVKREIESDILADMRADFSRAYHALDFVDDATAMLSCHVLDRSPGMIRSYRERLGLAVELEQKIATAQVNLERLRSRMNAICVSLRTEVEAFVLKEIDGLILRNLSLPPEEKRKVRAVVQLFTITATATPTAQKQLELDEMRQRAKDTSAKLAADINEAKAEVIKAQNDVAEMIKVLMNKPMMSGAERRFLESWRPGSTAAPLSAPVTGPAPAIPTAPAKLGQSPSGQTHSKPSSYSKSPPAQPTVPAASAQPPAPPPAGPTPFTRRRF